MHIGLIGGIGPAATGFYYRNLVRMYESQDRKIELTIVHADIHEVMQNIASNDPHKQAESFLHLAHRLETAGADTIGVASVAAHFCIEELRSQSPLLIVDAIAEVRLEIEKRELKRVGVLGTKGTMDSRLFGSISAKEIVLPRDRDLDLVHDAYIAMATKGSATNGQRDLLFKIGEDLCRRGGADSVVLAGTDLFLAFEGHDCGFSTIDCALVHAEALIRRSLDDKQNQSGEGTGGKPPGVERAP